MDVDNKRTEQYRKDELEEKVLMEMNQTLYPKELELIKEYDKPELPVIFIVGAQRSGTTLLMQLMINFFELAYPNNFIARYWNVPFTGAVLYKSLSKNYGSVNDVDLSSDLGYTKGLDGPHEFGYFWRKWFPWESWEEKHYDKIDYSVLQKQLDAWQKLYDKPIIFKNIVQVSFNIDKLNELFPNSFYIYIKRKPEFVVQSTLLSRTKLYNDQSKWLGLKPPEYNEIKHLPIIEQITAQVYYSRKHIEDLLTKTNHITVEYERVIEEPDKVLNLINENLNLNRKKYKLPPLKNTNTIKVEQDKFDEIKKYCKKYFKI